MEVSASIIAGNNNSVNIDATGTKITGTCNIIGPLTCTGASIFNGSVSGTAITTLMNNYYTKTLIDSNYFTKTYIDSSLNTKTYSESTYQKILSNSTEGTGYY